jgi:hypothetical protein
MFPIASMFFKNQLLNKYEKFKSLQIPYKFNGSFLKMIRILSHHKKNKMSHSLVLLYSKL